MSSKKEPGGGWGWIITLACFIEHILYIGSINTMGIYHVYIMDEFNKDITAVTLIGALYISVSISGAIFAVLLNEKFGERLVIMSGGFLVFIGYASSFFVTAFPVLYLTMAIIPGIGMSFSYCSLLVAVDKYFTERKFIAMSLAILGGSFGMVIMPILVESLLQKYGFHGAILVHAGISLNVIVCGAVVFPLPTEIVPINCKTNKKVDMKFCKEPKFIVYLITNFLFIPAQYIPATQLPETAVSIGIGMDEISLVVAMLGVGSGFGRLFFGFISHCFFNHVVKFWIVFLAGMGLMLLMVPYSTKIEQFLVFAVLYGFFDGGNNVGWNLSLKNLLEPQYYGRAMSLALLVEGIGCAIGNPLTAFLRETTGSGGIPYFIGCAILCVSAVILIPFSNVKQTFQEQEIIIFDETNSELEKFKFHDDCYEEYIKINESTCICKKEIIEK
ncbi:monocarboxylate transporter 13-like isoform X1 [Mytilus galloprovincialis]|uniref:monocarboxylate transporter 13-like isoform X1 n=1 Tax=Mytilus galloprovincialis TaxID=29158 RepID=UPI003F7BC78B